MSFGVYGHVVLGPREDEWRDFRTAVYDASRRRGVVRGSPEGAKARENLASSLQEI